MIIFEDSRVLTLAGIAAISEGRVLGSNGRMPWHIPDELAHFKKTTVGYPLLMGRATFDSIGRQALPNRKTIVIGRSRMDHASPDIFFSPTLAGGLSEAMNISEKAYVVGGAKIFEALLPYIDEFILTKIQASFTGDTYLPTFEHDFMDLERKEYESNINFTVSYFKRLPSTSLRARVCGDQLVIV